MDVFVTQLLRIENGKADFTIPVGRTPSGLVRWEQINGVSFEPGGRELEFGACYEMRARENITATGGIGIVHEERTFEAHGNRTVWFGKPAFPFLRQGQRVADISSDFICPKRQVASGHLQRCRRYSNLLNDFRFVPVKVPKTRE